MCGCVSPLAGGTCLVETSASTRTTLVEGFLWSDTGCGCFFLRSSRLCRLSWGTTSMIQSTEAFGRISYPGFARAVRTWIFGALFLYDLVSGSLFPRCLGVACGIRTGDDSCLWRNGWFNYGYVFCISTWLLDELHTFSTLPWTRTPEVFCLHFYAEWRRVFSRCLRLLQLWNLLHELHVAGSLHDEG